MNKKLITFFAVLCCTMFLTATAEIYSGTCGDKLNWAFNSETGVLDITGSGEMYNYGNGENAPWYPHREAVINVNISNGVTSIGSFAFGICSNMTTITIGKDVKKIEYSNFENRDKLQAVYISDLSAWCRIQWGNGTEIPINETHHIFLNDSEIIDLVIPNDVTSISAFAFYGCVGLKSVRIPVSVTELNYAIFHNCSNLKSITFESNIPPANIGYLLTYDMQNEATWDIYIPCGAKEKYIKAISYEELKTLIKYAPIPTITLNSNTAEGQVSKQVNGTSICDNPTAQLTATPNTGYHFAQWSDGDINNPRTVQLTQDTSFTAEFAKNVYTITASSNNIEYGFATGGKTAEYLDEITLTATAQIGHHFEYWKSGSMKYTDNPLQVTVKEDATYTAYFAPNVYTISVNADASQGYVTAPSQAEFLQEVTMTATPLNGYEFVQWNDGVKDNPRVFNIVQDTTFTAEFAKAQYTIATAVNDAERGTAIGDKVVNYLASVTLTATANHGYHFDHWQSGTKTYSANPLKVTATGNAIYTAYFVPNTYSVNAYSDNTSWGSVSAPSQADYLEWITLTANPVKGAEFVQWSDGNKDNPRYMLITQDTTISAEFAVLTSGHYNAEVYWHFSNSTLHISGYGDMYGECEDSWELLIPQIQTVEVGQNITHVIPAEMGKLYNLTSVVWNATNYTAPASESETPFYSKRNRITEFVFGKQVKKVPAYLCYEMTGLSKITLGSNVTNIGKHAFDGCEDLAAITCEAMTPPNCGTDAFAGVSIFIPVYVPVSSVEKYAKAPIWKDFDTFSSIQAEQKEVTSVQAQPSDNSVVLEWPAADADVYTLVIKCNGVIFCTLSFNAQGQLLGIQFVQGRNGAHNATYATQTATGWQFTITSLEAGTTYDYTVTAKKSDDTPVYTQSGSFTTTGTATGVDAVVDAESAPVKVIRNGQLYILHDGKMYTVQGQEVR